MSTEKLSERIDAGLSRREAIRRGLAGAAGLLMAAGPTVAARAMAAPPKAKAKSVIQIWLAGGPSHLDSFDPKPEAGNDYCGPLNNPIQTNVPGIRIGELLRCWRSRPTSSRSSAA